MTTNNNLNDVDSRALVLLTTSGYNLPNRNDEDNVARKRSRINDHNNSSNLREEEELSPLPVRSLFSYNSTQNDNQNDTEIIDEYEIEIENDNDNSNNVENIATFSSAIRTLMKQFIQTRIKQYVKFRSNLRKKKISLAKMEKYKSSNTFPSDINFSFARFSNCPKTLQNANDYKDKEANIILKAKQDILDNRIAALKEDLSEYKDSNNYFSNTKFKNDFKAEANKNNLQHDQLENFAENSFTVYKFSLEEEAVRIDENEEKADDRYNNRQLNKNNRNDSNNESNNEPNTSSNTTQTTTNNSNNLSKKDIVNIVREVIRQEYSATSKTQRKNENTPLHQGRQRNGVYQNEKRTLKENQFQKKFQNNSFNNDRRSNPKENYKPRVVQNNPPRHSNQTFQKKSYKDILKQHPPKRVVTFAEDDWKTVVNKNHRKHQQKQQSHTSQKEVDRGKPKRFPNQR